jgi:hypothetical protein
MSAALGRSMQWIEALINLSGFTGFLRLASYWPNGRQS